MLLKKWIAKKVRYFHAACSKNLYDEAHATRLLTSLSPLIVDWTYLPITDWAAGPEYYAHICNDIVVNGKNNVVECGSGISTILMARLINKNNLPAKIVSIDHDADWQHVVAKILESDGIRDVVQFMHSPLESTDGYSWYDTKRLNFPEGFCVDTVIVDGPIGNVPLARYGAVPYLHKFLSRKCYTIYLHDTDRRDELEISQRWTAMLPDSTVEYRSRYVVFQFGTRFCFSPQGQT